MGIGVLICCGKPKKLKAVLAVSRSGRGRLVTRELYFQCDKCGDYVVIYE